MEFRTFQKQWGAEFISDDVVRFRVWAEGQKELTLRLAATDVPMTATGNGFDMQITVDKRLSGDAANGERKVTASKAWEIGI